MLHYKKNPMFRENNAHMTLVQQMMKQINPETNDYFNCA